jgi:Phage integrase family
VCWGSASSVNDLYAGARVLRRHEVDRAAETLRRGWKTAPPWVFCSGAGTPLDLYNVTRVFTRMLKAAGLPNFRLYDLRHTFATLLLAQNAPITYVAAQLGHSKPPTTLQWYAHWLPSSRRSFVDALDEADAAPERVAVPFAAPTVAIQNPVVDLTPRPKRPRRGTNLAPIQEALMSEARQVGVNVGSPGRSRTCDILINSQALYRLSYRGIPVRPPRKLYHFITWTAYHADDALRTRVRPWGHVTCVSDLEWAGCGFRFSCGRSAGLPRVGDECRISCTVTVQDIVTWKVRPKIEVELSAQNVDANNASLTWTVKNSKSQKIQGPGIPGGSSGVGVNGSFPVKRGQQEETYTLAATAPDTDAVTKSVPVAAKEGGKTFALTLDAIDVTTADSVTVSGRVTPVPPAGTEVGIEVEGGTARVVAMDGSGAFSTAGVVLVNKASAGDLLLSHSSANLTAWWRGGAPHHADQQEDGHGHHGAGRRPPDSPPDHGRHDPAQCRRHEDRARRQGVVGEHELEW